MRAATYLSTTLPGAADHCLPGAGASILQVSRCAPRPSQAIRWLSFRGRPEVLPCVATPPSGIRYLPWGGYSLELRTPAPAAPLPAPLCLPLHAPEAKPSFASPVRATLGCGVCPPGGLGMFLRGFPNDPNPNPNPSPNPNRQARSGALRSPRASPTYSCTRPACTVVTSNRRDLA